MAANLGGHIPESNGEQSVITLAQGFGIRVFSEFSSMKFRGFLLVLSMLFLAAGPPELLAAEAFEKVPARLLTVRSGVPNVAARLGREEKVTIVFLGGSITENRAGFSSQFPRWLKGKYPSAEIVAINAGWGGTDSDLG